MKMVYSHITFANEAANNDRDIYGFQQFVYIINDQLMSDDHVVNWEIKGEKNEIPPSLISSNQYVENS